MKVSDLITVERERSVGAFGARGMWYYRATLLGRVSAVADTRADAVEAVLTIATTMLETHGEHEYHMANDGETVFCLRASGDGWAYDILHSNGPSQWMRASSCMMAGDRAHVRDAMRRHLEDYA